MFLRRCTATTGRPVRAVSRAAANTCSVYFSYNFRSRCSVGFSREPNYPQRSPPLQKQTYTQIKIVKILIKAVSPKKKSIFLRRCLVTTGLPGGAVSRAAANVCPVYFSDNLRSRRPMTKILLPAKRYS